MRFWCRRPSAMPRMRRRNASNASQSAPRLRLGIRGANVYLFVPLRAKAQRQPRGRTVPGSRLSRRPTSSACLTARVHVRTGTPPLPPDSRAWSNARPRGTAWESGADRCGVVEATPCGNATIIIFSRRSEQNRHALPTRGKICLGKSANEPTIAGISFDRRHALPDFAGMQS